MKKLLTASIKITKRQSTKAFIEELNSILGDDDFTGSYIESVKTDYYAENLLITCVKSK